MNYISSRTTYEAFPQLVAKLTHNYKPPQYVNVASPDHPIHKAAKQLYDLRIKGNGEGFSCGLTDAQIVHMAGRHKRIDWVISTIKEASGKIAPSYIVTIGSIFEDYEERWAFLEGSTNKSNGQNVSLFFKIATVANFKQTLLSLGEYQAKGKELWGNFPLSSAITFFDKGVNLEEVNKLLSATKEHYPLAASLIANIEQWIKGDNPPKMLDKKGRLKRGSHPIDCLKKLEVLLKYKDEQLDEEFIKKIFSGSVYYFEESIKLYLKRNPYLTTYHSINYFLTKVKEKRKAFILKELERFGKLPAKFRPSFKEIIKLSKDHQFKSLLEDLFKAKMREMLDKVKFHDIKTNDKEIYRKLALPLESSEAFSELPQLLSLSSEELFHLTFFDDTEKRFLFLQRFLRSLIYPDSISYVYQFASLPDFSGKEKALQSLLVEMKDAQKRTTTEEDATEETEKKENLAWFDRSIFSPAIQIILSDISWQGALSDTYKTQGVKLSFSGAVAMRREGLQLGTLLELLEESQAKNFPLTPIAAINIHMIKTDVDSLKRYMETDFKGLFSNPSRFVRTFGLLQKGYKQMAPDTIASQINMLRSFKGFSTEASGEDVLDMFELGVSFSELEKACTTAETKVMLKPLLMHKIFMANLSRAIEKMKGLNRKYFG
ncbi:hypothetical protein A2290_05970 [candidate division WOR-1 bacterium RIFOXYB2_FULL_36_35]|uniref:Uncharacterized protein n=1 Tax=candidate division WOR-1 bacterium RIFOXYB2_FULL_36_35 TaxID=1802578 RepID=A0A1F4S606_UNCSA|nr:MAG: hypothetical protein A2290_05970 [candidate division WOR-1 bacterium RIFOXYB2_FULL_36_35]